MARFQPDPFPDRTAYNLRKRAAQMDAIADAMQAGAVREVLHRKAEILRQKADEAEALGPR